MIKKILARLRASKAQRAGYVASQIDVLIPFQIRALRKQFGLEQKDLADLTGMKQPSISRLEKAGNRANLDTLIRIANGLDVALIVKFVPFSELILWSDSFSPDNFTVPDFPREMERLEKQNTTNNVAFIFRASLIESSPISPSISGDSTARLGELNKFYPQKNMRIEAETSPYIETTKSNYGIRNG